MIELLIIHDHGKLQARPPTPEGAKPTPGSPLEWRPDPVRIVERVQAGLAPRAQSTLTDRVHGIAFDFLGFTFANAYGDSTSG